MFIAPHNTPRRLWAGLACLSAAGFVLDGAVFVGCTLAAGRVMGFADPHHPSPTATQALMALLAVFVAWRLLVWPARWAVARAKAALMARAMGTGR
ncbi:MAG: hypothetical protein GC200_11505 [Tepidisphaera sp.]|nr:hypothetical protein [Tepidisphaera sp.]